MTTKVTVDAHAGFPVEVKKVFKVLENSYSVETMIVKPYTTHDFYVWSHEDFHSGDQMHLEIRELPLQK